MVLTCPHCSGQSSVPDQTVVASVHCPHCGGSIPLIAEPAQPIYATAYAAPGYSPADPYAPAGAGWSGPSRSPRVLACTSCGGTFTADQIIDQEGLILCHPCYEKRAAASEAAAAATQGGIAVLERCAGCGGAFPRIQMHETPAGLFCEACAGESVAVVLEEASASAAEPSEAPPVADVATSAQDAKAEPVADLSDSDAVNMGSAPATSGTFIARPQKQADVLKIVLGAGIAALVVVGGIVFYATQDDEHAKPVDKTAIAIVKPFEIVKPPPQTSAIANKVLPDDWEKRNGPQLKSLQRQARARSDRKDFDGASQTYEQLFLLLDENKGSVQDPDLKQVVDSARSEWNGVRSKLGLAPSVATSGPSKVTTSATADGSGSGFSQGTKPITAEVAKQVERFLSEAEFASKQGNKSAAFLRYKDLFALLRTERPRIEDKALLTKIASAVTARDDLGDDLRNRPEAADVTIDTLLKQGIGYLSAGKWQAGFESLSDVRIYTERRIDNADKIRSDAAYVTALHGIAVSYISLNQIPKAAGMFDEAATLGILAKTKPTRDLIWNEAVADIAQKTTAMRSVSAVQTFLDKDKEKVDEPLLNLLGTAIAAAFSTSGGDPKLAEAVKYYQERNAELEKTRPGAMHWGVNWLEGDAAKAMQEKRDSTKKVLDLKKHELDGVRTKVEQVLKGERIAINKGKSKIYVQRVNEDLLKSTRVEEAAKLKDYNDARAAVPLAAWITDLKPMIPGTGQLAGATTKPSSPAAVEKVHRYAAAFPIDRYRLVTAVGPIGAATKVRLEDTKGNVLVADVIHKGAKLAILEVSPGDVGKGMKFFSLAIGSSGEKMKCAALATPSIYGPKPEMIDGAKENKGAPVSGAWLISLAQHPRLAGAPLLEENRVVGVELAGRDDPKDKIPTATLYELTSLLDSLQATPTEEGTSPDPLAIYEVVIDVD